MRTPERQAPWHLWAVAVVALLWNGSGAYTIMMAQAGKLADLEEGEALVTRAALIVTVIIAVIAVAELAYTAAMKRHSVFQ